MSLSQTQRGEKAGSIISLTILYLFLLPGSLFALSHTNLHSEEQPSSESASGADPVTIASLVSPSLSIQVGR